MKRRSLAYIAAACGLCLFLLSGADTPGSSSCIKCHTDESTLKSLVKPPKTPAASEGEG